MRFRFSYKNEEEEKELKSILESEIKNHFFDPFVIRNGAVTKEKCVLTHDKNYKYFQVRITAKFLFQDFNKMRQSVYEQNGRREEEVLLHDFISDVEENLSFVSVMEVLD